MALKDKLPKISRRQGIAIFKGVLAYTLTYILIFLHPFNSLNQYPITLASTILVSIAGQPGLSTGACLDAGWLGMAGVGVGALFFFILAKLGGSQVAQGFVFFIFVYLMALAKAQSMRYFGFSLLAIIVAFSGAYTSILLGGIFSRQYLYAYLESYCWGFAIVLFVNLFIFPTSSERELRNLLIQSLERLSTFSHLIAKTYTLEISDEEKAVRDGLHAGIRADLAFLRMKHAQTGLEINWTRFSMADYHTIVNQVQQMQQGLITSYSSLIVLEKFEPNALEIIKEGLRESATGRAFSKLRRGLDLVMKDIVAELEIGKKKGRRGDDGEGVGNVPGELTWEDFVEFDDTSSLHSSSTSTSTSSSTHDPELGTSPTVINPKPTSPVLLQSSTNRPLPPRRRASSISTQGPTSSFSVMSQQLTRVNERLRQELETTSESPMGSRRGSISSHGDEENGGTTAVPSVAPVRIGSEEKEKAVDRVQFIKDCWEAFKREQNAEITRLLAAGIVDDDELRVYRAAPSLHDQFHNQTPFNPRNHAHIHQRYKKAQKQDQEIANGLKADSTTTRMEEGEGEGEEEKREGEKVRHVAPEMNGDGPPEVQESSREQLCGTAALRVCSFLYGMGQVLDEITSLHTNIVPSSSTLRPSRRLHFHFLEKIPRTKPKEPGLPLRQALAELSGREFVEKKVPMIARVAQLERMARSPTSLYAFKTACAVSVYAVFLLAPSLKAFFISYGLTGGIITIVVAMAPTLGQTFATFILQILGTGFGTMYGLLILRIFKDVGGYAYNPYGLTVFVALYATPMCWVIYTKPIFFAGALLALNGCGILIVTEYIYNVVPSQIRPGFDQPPLRAGKALVAMCIALAIAAIFQIFILRNPARQTLRINLSKITASLASYSVLFGMLTEGLVPIRAGLKPGEMKPTARPEAFAAVRKELIKREGQIQAELTALMPLLKFSSLEPAFGVPFQAATFVRLIRSHQIILDRLREARTAVGVEGFSPEIRETFTNHLSPYRAQNKRFTRALFYLISTSLATKTPLPHELPTMLTAAVNIQHDAMVLSSRLARTEEGRAILASQSFIRYWFYLIAYSGVSYNLEAMEVDLRILLGEIEDSPFVVQEREKTV